MDTATKKEFENLAGMVKRGFDEVTGAMARKIDVDKRFDQVDERFEQADKRFERVEERLIHIERDVSEVKYLEIKLGVESGK